MQKPVFNKWVNFFQLILILGNIVSLIISIKFGGYITILITSTLLCTSITFIMFQVDLVNTYYLNTVKLLFKNYRYKVKIYFLPRDPVLDKEFKEAITFFNNFKPWNIFYEYNKVTKYCNWVDDVLSDILYHENISKNVLHRLYKKSYKMFNNLILSNMEKDNFAGSIDEFIIHKFGDEFFNKYTTHMNGLDQLHNKLYKHTKMLFNLKVSRKNKSRYNELVKVKTMRIYNLVYLKICHRLAVVHSLIGKSESK